MTLQHFVGKKFTNGIRNGHDVIEIVIEILLDKTGIYLSKNINKFQEYLVKTSKIIIQT